MPEDSTTKVRLWFVKETSLARLYQRSQDQDSSFVWIPRSLCSHTRKLDNTHEIELPTWFVLKNRLQDNEI